MWVCASDRGKEECKKAVEDKLTEEMTDKAWLVCPPRTRRFLTSSFARLKIRGLRVEHQIDCGGKSQHLLPLHQHLRPHCLRGTS